MLASIADAYRRTRKPRDILWNRFVARPLAAVLLVPLARTSVTPNQITLATLIVFAAGAAVTAFVPGHAALVAGAVIIEISYVLDCVDGQLARLKGTSSPVGAHLDFLMDELKAFLLVGAVAVRLWLPGHEERWLLEGLAVLIAVATAISLTTFVRRPEYAAATGAVASRGAGDYGEGFEAPPPPRSLSPLRLVEALGRFIVHYPSYILFVALANRIDLFLHAYGALNAAYAARSLLGIAARLGEAAQAMKAIIVAAGRGRRLGPETDAIPKCMVSVDGRPILHRQLDALTAAGARDLVIVRGYLGERISVPGRTLRFVDNRAWAENNILASLLHAEHEMDGGFLFSYSDIVFATDHARRVAEATGGIALVIDRRWRDAYVGRELHPVSEAELARVEDTPAGPRVTRVGKRLVTADDAAGEFIGLARFSAEGGAALRALWREVAARGLDAPFGAAASLRQAYLTDALNELAARGVPLVPVLIDGRWREIDTEEDLARAHAVVAAWE